MATIQYSDVIDRQLLPVDAQNIVTRVRLVIAGDIAGQAPTEAFTKHAPVLGGDFDVVSYFPEPIVVEYEAPEHTIYGAEKAFSLPSGVNPFLAPEDPLIPEPGAIGISNPGVPSVVRDGDPLTYAEWSGSGQATLFYTLSLGNPITRLCAGYRLHYALDGTSTNPRFQGVTYLQHHRHAANVSAARYWRQAWYPMAVTGGVDEPTETYVVAPWDGHGSPDNNSGEVLLRNVSIIASVALVNDPVWRVYAFYPLILNEPLLEDIARAQIRLPAQLPQRVTVRGYVAPDREHTITGWPGGDYTGVVAQHQYELGRTVIDFEQAGSPVGLPAEAIEAARERKQAIDGTVQTANYNLMMGSRR